MCPFRFQNLKEKLILVSNFVFFIFLAIYLRDTRESWRNPVLEREFLLDQITTLKTVDICVKLLYLMRGLQIKYFFYLKMAYKNIFELEKKIYFRLFLSFMMVF